MIKNILFYIFILLSHESTFGSDLLYSSLVQCEYYLHKDFRASNSKLIYQHPSFKKVHKRSFKGLHPYQYEIDLARISKLSLAETIAITRNFHYRPVLTAETGILKLEDKVLFNANWNLINAYKKFINNLDINDISYNDLILLRRESMNFVMNKKTGNYSYRTKVRFNSKSKTLISDPIQEDVFLKVESFGQKYEVVKVNKIKGKFSFLREKLRKRGVKQVTIITHPTQEVIQTNIKEYIKKLNTLIKTPYLSPEYITTFAVRELLLIHPFGDGNGRTARLLGQILYKRLTGKTIIFPKEFKKEMSYSEQDLVKLIKDY